MKVKFLEESTKKEIVEFDVPTVWINSCFNLEDGRRFVIISYSIEENIAYVKPVSESYGKYDGAFATKNPEQVSKDET